MVLFYPIIISAGEKQWILVEPVLRSQNINFDWYSHFKLPLRSLVDLQIIAVWLMLTLRYTDLAQGLLLRTLLISDGYPTVFPGIWLFKITLTVFGLKLSYE